ncbi:MAG: hypothetical protein D6717_13580 [Gammaproteobacteria bacterium]|nr:MAG: hypothetical protein D6717_13580 [Gammaproteobacteria bacterium]
MIRALGLALLLLLPAMPAAATVLLTIDDLPGEGFNDPAAHVPKDGNAARTLGQARLNALWHALLRYELRFEFTIPLTVTARMDPLGGTANRATLAQAGPNGFFLNPSNGVLYPAAQANQVANRDLDPDSSDITAVFNSDVDGNTVLGNAHWYYGFSGQPPGQDQDFVATALHELLHGLGFVTLLAQDGSLPTSTSGAELPDIYFRQLASTVSGTTTALSTLDAPDRAVAITSIDKLVWNGTETIGSNSGNAPLMYAPDPYEAGSSVSHFDTTLSPDELMEPIATPTWRDNLAMAAMRDMGWNMPAPTATVPPVDLQLTHLETIDASGLSRLRLQLDNLDNTSTARQGYLVATLPDGVRYISAQLDGNALSCSLSAGLLRCPVQALAPLQTSVTEIGLCSTTDSPVTLQLTFSGPHDDAEPANNTLSLATPVARCATSSSGGGGGGGTTGLFTLAALLFASLGRRHLPTALKAVLAARTMQA